MNESPISLFVYNRPWHTRQTVEALLKNELAGESDLIVFSDGVKPDDRRLTTDDRGQRSVIGGRRPEVSNHRSEDGDQGINEHRTCNIEHSTSNQAYITSETDDRRQTTDDRVREVREYIRTIRGFKSVRIVERDTNLGLAKSIISGVAEVINEYGRIIVLEDDMVTSPYFLRYMNEALELYEKEDKVISIHGYVYPIQDLPETFFIKGADCWGWATWKRGWDLFEQDGKKLLKKLEDGNLTSEFDNDGAYPYTKMLRDQIRGKNNSWAIRWYASAFLNDKLTLYPGSSLVKNIGLDDSGTHNDSTDYFNVELIGRIPELKNIPMERNLEASRKFRDFLVNIPKPSFFSRIRRKAKRLLN